MPDPTPRPAQNSPTTNVHRSGSAAGNSPLFFEAEFLQDRREHGEAKRDNPRRARHRTFFFEDMALDRGLFRPAEFLGPIAGQPAARVQNRVPMLQIVFAKLTVAAHLGGKVRRDVFVQKGPHLVQKRRSSAV